MSYQSDSSACSRRANYTGVYDFDADGAIGAADLARLLSYLHGWLPDCPEREAAVFMWNKGSITTIIQ